MAQPQQSQPQYTLPANYTSPLQSANTGNLAFNIPPHKRQRTDSPQQPQPSFQSPYANNMSPNSSTTPTSTTSTLFPTVAIPQGAYSTPYSTTPNGNTSNFSLPQTSTGQQSSPQFQQTSSNFHLQNQNQNNQPTNFSNYGPSTPGAGTMGPPSKPVDKSKEDGIDPMDVLGGTGVDLKEEEQYSFQMINNSFNSQVSGSQSGTISSGHSFTQFPPGDEASFFGAGPANAPAEKATFESQDEFNQHARNKAWAAAANNLNASRKNELANPFLQIGLMHAKMQKIARENGLSLNTDKTGMMGHMKLPPQFENKDVRVSTMGNSEVMFATTTGGFVPDDSMLVDHLALLSIATKYRLRNLIEGANKLALGRQTGSHGIVPEEWADVAAPVKDSDSSIVTEGALRNGWESAVSPHSNPLKRSFSAANKMPTPVSDGGKTPAGTAISTNEVLKALRQSAAGERDLEEKRLAKRLARNNGEATPAPRQNSVIPGTPGSVAPDFPDKAPTKKEQKKKAEAKFNEAASHAAANVTTAQFLGGGSSLFGKKKKKYDWMTPAAGGSTSGASTPGRINTQIPGTPAAAPQPERLTVEGARRLGSWREDKEKGKKIQIRDWITVLEEDGHDKRSLQKAYMNLDASDPK